VIRDVGPFVDLGEVTCIEAASVDANSEGDEDLDQPEPGGAFFYLVEYIDESRSSYGTETVGKPRVPVAGDCQ
jgi:hypothetical protein